MYTAMYPIIDGWCSLSFMQWHNGSLISFYFLNLTAFIIARLLALNAK